MNPQSNQPNLPPNALANDPTAPPVMVNLMNPGQGQPPAGVPGQPGVPAQPAPAGPMTAPNPFQNQGAPQPGQPGQPGTIPPPSIPIDPAALQPTGVAPQAPGAPVPPIPPAPKRGGGRGKLVAIIALVVIVLGGAGGAAWFFLGKAKPKPTAKPSVPVSVTASLTDLGVVSGSATLPVGASTNQLSPVLGFKVQTEGNDGTVVGEVEVVAVGTEFTGTPTATGKPVAANGSALPVTVTSAELKDGSYRWQARIKIGANVGDWVPAGTDPTKADFVIDTVAPTKPVLKQADSQRIDPAAKTAAVTTPKPTLIGTADPANKIEVNIQPEGTTMQSEADASGNWTITPASDIPNGEHEVTVAATDSAGNTASEVYKITTSGATASASAAATPTPSATPAATATPTPSATPAATPTPTPNTTVAEASPSPSPEALASTGDPVQMINWLCFLALALVGMIWWGLHRARV